MREDVYVYSFNPFNIPDPDRSVVPLDSGYSKEYRQRWEMWCKQIEPVLCNDPLNLTIEIVNVNGKPEIIRAYSQKMHHSFSLVKALELQKKIFGG